MAGTQEQHTVRSYDQQLDQLSVALLELGGLVIDQLNMAVQALVGRDKALANRVLVREDAVNALDTRIEELSVHLLATRAPVGADLRAVLAMLKAGTDLERSGDEAKKIAKVARELAEHGIPPAPRMAETVTGMAGQAETLLRDALAALEQNDEQRAVQVALDDKQLDKAYKQALKESYEYLRTEPDQLSYVADAVLVIKALERIGDHAANIAKYAVFVVQGRDVRHVKAKTLKRELKEGPAEG